jgi:PAS domain S-box-containing protein
MSTTTHHHGDSTSPPLRVLLLEDNPRDAKLTVRLLEGGGFRMQSEVTDSLECFGKCLEKADYDVIVSDFNLRNWTALDALETLKRSGKDIPLIVVTGSLGDEAAAECIKQGAADFVLKDRPARLPTAIQRALDEKRHRTENQRDFETISRLATIVESSDDAIIGKSLDGVITSWNKGAEKLYGYPTAEVLGQPISIVAPSDRAEEMGKILASLRSGTLIERFETVRVRKDGSRIDVSLGIFPLRDTSGRITGAASIARDITEHKRAEESLRESAKRARIVAESVTDVIYEWDLKDKIEWHGDVDSLMGYPAGGFPRTMGAWAATLHPEDLERVRLAIQSQLKGEAAYNIEYRIAGKDGGWRWWSARGTVLRNDQGHAQHWVGAVTDITERKQAQEEVIQSRQMLKSVLDTIPERVFWKDRNIVYLGCNQAFALDAGLKDPAEIIGKTDYELAWKATAESYRTDDKLVMEQETPRLNYEEIQNRPDASLIWLRTSKLPLRDREGKVIGMIGTYEDITEHKRREEALRESEERFRATFENAGIGIALVDMQGRSFKSNPMLVQMLGYSKEELSRMTFPEYTHPDDREVEWQLFSELAAGKYEKYEIEKRFLKKDGGVVWGLVTVSLIKGRDGRPVCAVGMVLDVTERKRAEVKFQEQRNFIEAVLDSAQSAIIACDAHGSLTLFNQATRDIFGLPSESIPSEDWSQYYNLYHADGKTLMKKEDVPLFRALQGEKLSNVEVMVVPKRSEPRVLVTSGQPIIDAKGRNLGAVVVFHDITERKHAEGTLRVSEIRYRRLFEAAHDGILILDADSGEITDVNPFLTNLLGFSHAELLGKKLWEIGPLRDVFLSKAEFLELQTKGYVRYENLPLQTKAGKRVAVEFVSNVYLAGDQKVIQCNIRDITEQKQREAERTRLMTAIEQAAESVVVTDAEGIIEYVNPAFSIMTGYSREEALGKNPRFLKSGKQDAAFYASLWATILAGQVWRGEMINRRKDGGLYTGKMSITPVYNEHRKMTHIVAMKEDITARKLLEDQFRQAQKMEAVGRLAAGVAHDFNNLLTIIIGYSDLMLDQFGADNPMRAYTTAIKGAGEKAAGLTRQLLAFSRQQVLAPQVLDLNTLIANMTKMLKRLIGEDIDLVFNAGPSPAMVKADPGLIEQVLMNLAVNSRDAMPQGGKLTINTSPVQIDEAYNATHFTIPVGSYVMLAVSDTGCGMDKDTQAHIFEPFFTTKEVGKGTGLGLATVFGIVKQSGGSIWVYSEPGAGTTFKIYLPSVTGALRAAQENTVPAGGSETVLLVEDDASLRELARMVLVARGGYKVLESIGGKEARLFAGEYKGPIHLLLTDVVMPGMGGRELSEELATLRPEMKVLYMSGYTDDTVVRHGVLEEGMAFLQKPFTAESLLRKVRDVLDTRPHA